MGAIWKEAASPPPNPAGKSGCQDPRTPSLLTPCHTNYCIAAHTSMAQRCVCCFASAGISRCTADVEQPGDTRGAAGSAQGHRHGAQSQHSQQGWWHQKCNGQKWGNGDLQLQMMSCTVAQGGAADYGLIYPSGEHHRRKIECLHCNMRCIACHLYLLCSTAPTSHPHDCIPFCCLGEHGETAHSRGGKRHPGSPSSDGVGLSITNP